MPYFKYDSHILYFIYSIIYSIYTVFYILCHLCKCVALRDVVLEAVHLQVHAEVEVFPDVEVAALVLGQAVAFEPRPLWYPRVLHSGLDDAHAVVLQVVVDDDGTYAVHLRRAAFDVLLQVPVVA